MPVICVSLRRKKMKTVLIEKPFEIAVTDTQMPVPGEAEHFPGRYQPAG